MLRKKLTIAVILTALLMPAFALGQATSPAVYTAPKETIDKIRDEGMNRSQVMQTLSYLTDVIGPRLTGSPNMKRANEWTRDKMKEWGMQNAGLESWGPFGRGWSLRKFSATIVEPQYTPVIGYPSAWSPSTKGAVTGEVVHISAKTPEDLAKYKGQLAGKIVLVSNERVLKPIDKPLMMRMSDEDLTKLAAAPDPSASGDSGNPPPAMIKNFVDSMNFQAKKMKFLIDEGAAVMLENSNNGSGGTIFVQGASVGVEMGEIKTIDDIFNSAAFQPHNKKWEANMMPQATLATEDYNRLVRMIKLGAKPKMTVEIDSQFHDDDPMQYNTVAEIPGSDPALKDEVVMLGGHLDSWHSGTGATDNGAGCAAVMEAARIIIASGLKPRRTIRVALWSGEEQGIFGSTNYVKKHFGEKKDGTLVKGPDYDKLSAYYNLDNGTGKIRGVYMQGNAGVRPYFEAWLAPFADLGAKTLTMSNTGGTDHLPFDGIGLPGFQFIQDTVEYNTRTHHSNQDNFDRIQPEDMKQSATIIAAFAYQTAMMDGKLPRKAIK
ncbi:MAG: M20/M25/M40 family metallo-hydrolase [Pyrinomonadaceae bacterium]|nr:M20/M25/M40 family metallo-hydrolase [Pyrinomonadaceae bacterium]